jgi:hypothetical protein
MVEIPKIRQNINNESPRQPLLLSFTDWAFHSELIRNYGSCRVCRAPCMGNQPCRKTALTQDNTDTELTQADIHAPNGIRTHDSSVRAVQKSTCLRSRGLCNRPCGSLKSVIFFYNCSSALRLQGTKTDQLKRLRETKSFRRI